MLRWPVRVPFPSCFSSSRRGCWDRLSRSKQTAAMAGAIFGAKVSEAQCFRGFAAETWRVAAHGRWRRWAFGGGRIRAEWPKLLWAGRRPKLETGALSGRIWRELCRPDRFGLPARCADRRLAELRPADRGNCGQEVGGIGQAAFGGWRRRRTSGGIGRAAFGFTEIREVHRNVGIPGWYADIGIHWNAGPGSGPDDFCGLGGSLRCRPLAGARPENRGPSSKPAGRAGLGFLPSTAREFAKRRAEQDGKTQRGRGGGPGCGPKLQCWRDCGRWGRRRRGGAGGGAAALSKNNNCGTACYEVS